MSDPIPEPDDQFTADMVGRDRKRLMIAEKKAEVLAHYIDGLNFCPDHRDKVRGRGRCMACDLETAERRRERLAEALREARDAIARSLPPSFVAADRLLARIDSTLAAYAPEGGEEPAR